MLTGKQLVLKTSGPSGLLGSSPRLSANGLLVEMVTTAD